MKKKENFNNRKGEILLTFSHGLVLIYYFQVIAENPSGLLFKNKRDRKILNVDPKVQLKNANYYNLLHLKMHSTKWDQPLQFKKLHGSMNHHLIEHSRKYYNIP